MIDSFYAIRSKEGTAVIDTNNGCVQVFETWEQAVSATKRNTDEIVAVTIKRVGSEQQFNEVQTQNAELVEQINSLQAAYGRAVDERFEEKKELKAQLAKVNERVIDSIIEPLFKARWSGDLSSAPVSEMRSQLLKTLRDQTMGYWSGRTAYNIAVDGGFLVNDKKGANKRLTSLGAMLVEQEQLRKEQEHV